MNSSQKLQLSNGLTVSDLCYGSAIVLKYRYGQCSKKNIVKYWIRNAIQNRNQFKKDIALPKVINAAMNNGCCTFDTSRAYAGSEYVLGKTLKKYSRDQYQIITKLSNSDQYAGSIRLALEKSLKELATDYVDLYLMHWPVEGYFVNSWKQMEQLYNEGLCKAIGVCNFNIHHLKDLEKHATIMPMVNQFECHPLLTQNELRNYCKEHEIQVMAYTATARMDERLSKTVLKPIAAKYKKSVAQVILRWHQQIGNIPIVNSSNIEHLLENTQLHDFTLTEDEVKKITEININSRLRYDPDNCDYKQL